MKRTPLEDLPLFADDDAIGQALLGALRAREWKDIAPLYERQGFPRIDPIMGGRYVPAVRAFFDRQHGLLVLPGPIKRADGIERPEGWNAPKSKRLG